MNKQALYESIMSKVAKLIKKTINEDYDDYKNDSYNFYIEKRNDGDYYEESDDYCVGVLTVGDNTIELPLSDWQEIADKINNY